MVKAHSESDVTQTESPPVAADAAAPADDPAATMADLADLEAVVREEVGALRRRLDRPERAAPPAAPAAPAAPAPAPRRSRLVLVVVAAVFLAALVAAALVARRRRGAAVQR